MLSEHTRYFPVSLQQEEGMWHCPNYEELYKVCYNLPENIFLPALKNMCQARNVPHLLQEFAIASLFHG